MRGKITVNRIQYPFYYHFKQKSYSKYFKIKTKIVGDTKTLDKKLSDSYKKKKIKPKERNRM